MRARTRTLLRSIIAVGALLGVLPLESAPVSGLQDEMTTGAGIDHVVVIIEQNHTFDSYFGSYPGADGFGTVPDHEPIHALRYEPDGSAESAGLSNARSAAVEAIGAGSDEGFVDAQARRGHDGDLSLVYRDRETAPVLWQMADNHVLFDRYFSSAPGASLANTLTLMTGGPQGITSDSKDSLTTVRESEIPTVFDRLQDNGESWQLYVGRLDELDPEAIVSGDYERSESATPSSLYWAPALAMPRFWTDPDLRSGLADQSDFYRDAASGDLPAVSFVLPQPTDHPASSGSQGHTRLQSLVNAVIKSPDWERTAVFVVWDDWGGFYDHVTPPAGFGFRVPMLLLSPQARQGYVSSVEHDHASVLNFIVERFGLEPLGDRQRAASSFADVFLPAGSRSTETGLIMNQSLESTPVGTDQQNNATLAMYLVAALAASAVMAKIWRVPRPLGVAHVEVDYRAEGTA